MQLLVFYISGFYHFKIFLGYLIQLIATGAGAVKPNYREPEPVKTLNTTPRSQELGLFYREPEPVKKGGWISKTGFYTNSLFHP